MSDQRDDQRTGRKPDSDSPEWWALFVNFCTCGHSFDRHPERVDSIDASAGTHMPCDLCACQDFELAQSTLDIQNARE
jgi:hypothetical protein